MIPKRYIAVPSATDGRGQKRKPLDLDRLRTLLVGNRYSKVEIARELGMTAPTLDAALHEAGKALRRPPLELVDVQFLELVDAVTVDDVACSPTPTLTEEATPSGAVSQRA